MFSVILSVVYFDRKQIVKKSSFIQIINFCKKNGTSILRSIKKNYILKIYITHCAVLQLIAVISYKTDHISFFSGMFEFCLGSF